MKNQQIDLLRVGRLALRAARNEFYLRSGKRPNRFAGGLEEMHYSTRLPLETCQEVMEQLAKQASQREYETDLNEIRSAKDKVRREKKQAAEMGHMAQFSGLERAWLSLQEEARHG